MQHAASLSIKNAIRCIYASEIRENISKQDLNAFARKRGRYCCFLEFLDPGWRNASVFIPSLERQYAIP